MDKDRREKIMLKAIELYLIQGYDGMSISNLQADLDMGRGTLYYYFKDKDQLFEAVMERFFIQPKQRSLSALKEDVTIPQMIESLLRYLDWLAENLAMFENQRVNTSNVVSLMYTAFNRFPTLYRKANQVYERELALWKMALRNEQRAGIIRSDVPIDLVAQMFTHLKDGYDSGRAGVTMDFSIFPDQYNYLYSLLKR